MSKREHILIWAVAVVIGVLVFDRYVLTPYIANREAAENRRLQLQRDLVEAQRTMRRRRAVSAQWRTMLGSGLAAVPSEAEGLVLKAADRWSDESGFELVNVRLERTDDSAQMGTMAFRASGSGALAAVARFVFHLETSELPLKVKDLQISARTAGTDQLNLDVRFQVLFAPRSAVQNTAATGSRRSGERS